MTTPSREELAQWQRLAEAGDFEALFDVDGPVLQLIEMIREYEHAISWDTTCTNCSHLLDQLYDRDMRLERLREKSGICEGDGEQVCYCKGKERG